MKRIISVLLSIATLFSMFGLLNLSVDATETEPDEETYVSGDYEYRVLSDGTAEIVKYLGNDTSLILPQQIDEYTVKSIGKSAFYGCEELTDVAFGYYETVGDYSFYNCKSLQSVQMYGLSNVGSFAFGGCTNLEDFYFGNIYDIGDFAFSGCANLPRDISLSSIKTIGRYAFENCTHLKTLSVSSGVIGDFAFSGCTSLENVNLFDKNTNGSVSSIGAYAFFGCSKLKSVYIPDGVTDIGEKAFGYIDDKTRDRGFVISSDNKVAETYAEVSGVYIVEDLTEKEAEIRLLTTEPSDERVVALILGDYTRGHLGRYNNKFRYYWGRSWNNNEYLGKKEKIFTSKTIRSPGEYSLFVEYGGMYEVVETITFHRVFISVNENSNKYQGILLLDGETLSLPPIEGKRWWIETDTEKYYLEGDTFKTTCEAFVYLIDNKTYAVNYNANGGVGAPDSQSFAGKESVVLSKDIPTRNGFRFKGWASKPDGGVIYNPGDCYNVQADITLYAVWESPYTVSYELNGGRGVFEAQSAYIGEQIGLYREEPIRVGYNFKGWSTEAYGEVEYLPGDTYDGEVDVTLYAIWAEICDDCGGKGYLMRECIYCNGVGYLDKHHRCMNVGCESGWIYYEKKVNCSNCNGNGMYYDRYAYDFVLCLECFGSGRVTVIDSKVCDVCGGDLWCGGNCDHCEGGKVWSGYCETCDAMGEIFDDSKEPTTIPFETEPSNTEESTSSTVSTGSTQHSDITESSDCQIETGGENESSSAIETESLTTSGDISEFEYVLLGDTDLSGKVNIKDATNIQKYIAKLIGLSPKSLMAADSNEDGRHNIKDATEIQKYLAHLGESKVGSTIELAFAE